MIGDMWAAVSAGWVGPRSWAIQKYTPDEARAVATMERPIHLKAVPIIGCSTIDPVAPATQTSIGHDSRANGEEPEWAVTMTSSS